MNTVPQLDTGTDGVVLCFDSRYVWPACVTLHSVVQTWASTNTLNVYCLSDASLTGDDRALLTAVARHGGARLTFREVNLDVTHVNAAHVTKITYARAAAPGLIDARHLVYLDCDLIVRTSVHTLLRSIAADYPLAAARDVYGPELSAPHVGPQRFPYGRRSGTFPYFNAGVLAVDVRRWRDQKIGDRAQALMRDPDWRPALDDQDTLNYVVDGRFEMLDPRWNVAPVAFLKKTFDPPSMPGEQYVPVAYQRDLEESPWIVHYVTAMKPWTADFGDDPLGRLWHDTAAGARRVLDRARRG